MSFSTQEVRQQLIPMQEYLEAAAGVMDRADYLTIDSLNLLHGRRWKAARQSSHRQLVNAIVTDDEILVAEAILTAAAALSHTSPLSSTRTAVRLAGARYREWATPLWLSYVVYPAHDLYREATHPRTAGPPDLEELIDAAMPLIDATA
jgi:hypothetical protein